MSNKSYLQKGCLFERFFSVVKSLSFQKQELVLKNLGFFERCA